MSKSTEPIYCLECGCKACPKCGQIMHLTTEEIVVDSRGLPVGDPGVFRAITPMWYCVGESNGVMCGHHEEDALAVERLEAFDRDQTSTN